MLGNERKPFTRHEPSVRRENECESANTEITSTSIASRSSLQTYNVQPSVLFAEWLQCNPRRER